VIAAANWSVESGIVPGLSSSKAETRSAASVANDPSALRRGLGEVIDFVGFRNRRAAVRARSRLD
jgi:hypothetical protein